MTGVAAGTRAPTRRVLGLRRGELALMLAVSAAVLLASHRHWWAIGVAEAWGFVTGGACVWLVVREQPANWPVGLANNVVFFVLFWRSRLFADMGLQVVYFALGVYGWIHWLHGGERGTALRISRTTRAEWLWLAAVIPLSCFGLRVLLIAINGAAPFWDALTTVLSLAAQVLLTRKRLENWWFWIAADLIYMPLYLSRGLPLTAVLYGVLLLMCVVGLRAWCGSRAEPGGSDRSARLVLAMADSDRKARAQARRARIVLRKARLQATEEDLSPLRGAEAVSLVHRLTREAWSLSGLPEPTYSRQQTPWRFVPRAPR